MHPIQIVFRGMKPSESVESRIRERIARLCRIERRFTSCHVVVQAPHQSQQQGNRFDVRLHARFPGGELDISANGGRSVAHEDVYAAIAETFYAAERQLLRKLAKQHHAHDTDTGPFLGRIGRLSRESGYGFIETADGSDVYFNENVVAEGNFYELQSGDEVYVELDAHMTFDHLIGDFAPRAKHVRPLDKHHLTQ